VEASVLHITDGPMRDTDKWQAMPGHYQLTAEEHSKLKENARRTAGHSHYLLHELNETRCSNRWRWGCEALTERRAAVPLSAHVRCRTRIPPYTMWSCIAIYQLMAEKYTSQKRAANALAKRTTMLD